MSERTFPCPCCGFQMFAEPPGSYDICRVCGWEDDHVQLAFPNFRGGANGESLADAQSRLLEEIPVDVIQHSGYYRAPQWRPLNVADLGRIENSPVDLLSYFHAAADISPRYYWEDD